MFKFNKLSNLKELFERYITISAITEDFIAFDVKRDVDECFAYMTEKHFDIIGVKESGHIIGYAQLIKEDKGLLGEHKVGFGEDETLLDSDPLPEAVYYLAKKPYLFVKASDEIVGIITRADLYKPAVRIWVYGLVSILEIHMLELIGRLYSGNEWLDKLGDERQKKVLQEHKDLRQRNEEIDLLYCTQFCDKRTIIKKSDEALKAIGFKSAKDFSKNLKDIEELRNEIAHSCKVSKARWETVSELCKKIESLIDNIENFLSSKIQAKRALKREI